MPVLPGQDPRLYVVEGGLCGLNLPLPASGVFGPALQIGVELIPVPMVVGQGSIHIGDRQAIQLFRDLLRGDAAPIIAQQNIQCDARIPDTNRPFLIDLQRHWVLVYGNRHDECPTGLFSTPEFYRRYVDEQRSMGA
jgi:hypothetical protein